MIESQTFDCLAVLHMPLSEIQTLTNGWDDRDYTSHPGSDPPIIPGITLMWAAATPGGAEILTSFLLGELWQELWPYFVPNKNDGNPVLFLIT